MNIIEKIFKHVPVQVGFSTLPESSYLLGSQLLNKPESSNSFTAIFCKAFREQGTTFPTTFEHQFSLLNNPKHQTDLPS